MTGKTLTINDLMRVPVTQPAAGTIVVPAQPVEEEEGFDLHVIVSLIREIRLLFQEGRAFLDEARKLAEELTPEQILSRWQAKGLIDLSAIGNNPINFAGTGHGSSSSNLSSINPSQILEMLKGLPIPPDAKWEDVLNFAEKILGGGNVSLGSMDKKPSERSSGEDKR